MYRITNGMIADNTLRNISAAAVRLAEANEAVASNMKIQLASDDTTVATRAVTYRSYVSQIEQYQENAESADAWQTATDDALDELVEDITTLKEIATAASSESISDTDLENYATSVEQLLEDIVNLMNTDYNGSYIFGGYSTTEEPYEIVTTDIGETVTYKGQYLSLGSVIASDVSDETIEDYLTDSASEIYNSLTEAATDAYSAYTTALAASTADPTNIILAAKTASALTNYNTITAAVTTYGGTTNLTDATAAAESDYETITDTITTTVEASTTTLTDAAADALTAYTTAAAAAAADPTNTDLAEAAADALEISDALAAAVTALGGTTTLADAAESGDDVLATAIKNYIGGTTTLSDAAATALDIFDTLAAASVTYGDSTTLTSAASSAKTAYDTAYAADPTSTETAEALATYNILSAAITTYGSTATVSEAAEEAEATSDALATAVATYGGTSTLSEAAEAAKTTYEALAGADADAEQNIDYNIGFSTEVTVNVEGQDITGEGSSSVFNTIQKLLLALNGDTSYKTASMDSSGNVTITTNELSITDLIDELSDSLELATTAQATLGVSMEAVTNVTDRLDDAYEAYSALMTDNENIDTATATTELTSAEYTYEAALAVGAKVISKTLIDYIG
ncbi:MAG: flagellar hook-associated protein 3 [Firmicutes bacterium]|nr:flagellar hook-associated protein 3 [Bacillota bacterium]